MSYLIKPDGTIVCETAEEALAIQRHVQELDGHCPICGRKHHHKAGQVYRPAPPPAAEPPQETTG